MVFGGVIDGTDVGDSEGFWKAGGVELVGVALFFFLELMLSGSRAETLNGLRRCDENFSQGVAGVTVHKDTNTVIVTVVASS